MILAFSGTRKDPLRPLIRERIRERIAETKPSDSIVVCDCESGVDAYVKFIVGRRRMLIEIQRAWDQGSSAGPIGNGALAFIGDALVAFPERDEVAAGSGTWSAVRAFEKLGKPVEVFGQWRRLSALRSPP